MISDVEIAKLEKLVRIDYSGAEKDKFKRQFSGVLEMIDSLQKIDCADIEPLRSVCDAHQRLTEDVVKCKDVSNDLFQNVPDQGRDLAKEVKCFVVPKVKE